MGFIVNMCGRALRRLTPEDRPEGWPWENILRPRLQTGELLASSGKGGEMTGSLGGGMVRLAVLLALSLPALADTQFRVKKMTRDDVPLGKGQCDIRLRIDDEAEVSVRGDTVYLRTISGRDGRDEGSECNEPLPERAVEGFNFEVRDSRGEMVLLAEPSRRNGFSAVVRIRDSEGGEGRYHFRLSWEMQGGGPRSGNEPGPEPGIGRRGSAVSLGSALDACGDAVSERVAGDYRLNDVEILNARIESSPRRNDYIIDGEAVGRRGRSTAIFSYSCRVDSNSGRVLTVDLRRR